MELTIKIYKYSFRIVLLRNDIVYSNWFRTLFALHFVGGKRGLHFMVTSAHGLRRVPRVFARRTYSKTIEPVIY